MEEKKKDDTIKNVVIIILVVCVLVLGGLLLYKEVFAKKDKLNNVSSNNELVNTNFTIRNTVGEIKTTAGNFIVDLSDYQVFTTNNTSLGYAMLSENDRYEDNHRSRYDFSEYDWNDILQASSEGVYLNSGKDYSGIIYKYDNSGNKIKEFKPTYESKDKSVSITIVDNDIFFAKGTYLYHTYDTNGEFDKLNTHKFKSIIKDGDYTFIDVETNSCGDYSPEVSIRGNVILAAPRYNEFGIKDDMSLIVYYPSPAGDFILAEQYDCGDYGQDDYGMGGTLVTKSGKTIGSYSYGAYAYTITGEPIGPYYGVDKTGIYIMDATATESIITKYGINVKVVN